ncbi:MAG: ABC transporter permease [Halanaerobiales bacterium]
MIYIKSYLLRRLILLVPLLLGITLLVFISINFIPGDPVKIMLGIEATGEMVEQLRIEHGLNQPLYIQYFSWLGRIMKGDFGRSIVSGNAVASEITKRWPVTLQLVFLSSALSIIIAIPAGIISAVKQNSFVDYFIRVISLSFISLPSFAMAIFLILFVSLVYGWMPPLGFANLWESPLIALQIMALPVIALGVRLSAVLSRMLRSTMLEVLREDYIRTARAKGLKEKTIVYKHAVKNAFIPVLTMIGMQIGYLIGGTVIIELVFSLPGLGRFLLTGINNRDFPVVMAITLLIAVSFALINTIVDILYGVFDPRIKY